MPQIANAVWEEAFEIANRSKVLRKIAGVVNVVVLDKTQTPPPPTFPKDKPKVIATLNKLDPRGLTFWWRAGGALDYMLGKCDVVVQADGWECALKGICEAARKRKSKIGSLQFWGHGSDGAAYMAGEALNSDSFKSTGKHIALLHDVRGLMHPKEGSVWYRVCQAFRSAKGKTFAKTTADFFKVPAVGHTFIIWALQSGTKVLDPGKSPDWDDDEGHGKKNDDLWSDPFRNHTVSMLRFYPPDPAADFLSAVKLLECSKLILG
jgi:hypothetical protein